jgi:hypothetical protein
MSPRLWSVVSLVLPLLGGCSSDRKPCKIVFPEGFEGAAAIVWDVRSATALPTEGAMLLIEVPPGGVVETSSPLQTGTIKDELYWRKGATLAPIPEEKRVDRTTGSHRSCGNVEEIVIGDKARIGAMKGELEAKLDTVCGGPGSAPAAGSTIPDVVAGVGIGRVHLGMTRAELDRLGLPISDGPMLAVGSFRVILDSDHVTIVETSLASWQEGARVGGEVIAPGEKDVERIAKSLPGCGKPDVKPGETPVTTITCAGGTTHVKSTGPGAVVTIDVMGKDRAAQAAGK